MIRALIAALLALAGCPAAAAPPDALRERARILADLRREIGLMEADLQAERAQGLAQLTALSQQVARLEAERDALAAQAAADRAQVARAEARAAAEAAAVGALQAAVAEGAAALRAAVAASLPYRLAERLEALDMLAAQVADGQLPATEGAARLWRLAEDELRLSGELARAAAPVALAEGEAPRLLEVVQLGGLALLTRLPGAGFGWLRRVGGAWRHDPLPPGADPAAVAQLFSDLDRKLRGGLYRLPLPAAAP